MTHLSERFGVYNCFVISVWQCVRSILDFLNLFGRKSPYPINVDLPSKVDTPERECRIYDDILDAFKVVLRQIFNDQTRSRGLGMRKNPPDYSIR